MESVRIAKDTYMHVYLHEVSFTLEENFSQSDDSSSNFGGIDFEKSAKTLIDGMEDHWCVALLEAIKKECDIRIHKHWEKFSPKKNK